MAGRCGWRSVDVQGRKRISSYSIRTLIGKLADRVMVPVRQGL